MTETYENTYSTEPPTDTMKLLAHEHRAHIITVLKTHDSLHVTAVAELIADKIPDENTSVSQIATALKHRHLPMLTNANVVEKHGDTLSAGTHLDVLHTAYEAFCDELQ